MLLCFRLLSVLIAVIGSTPLWASDRGVSLDGEVAWQDQLRVLFMAHPDDYPSEKRREIGSLMATLIPGGLEKKDYYRVFAACRHRSMPEVRGIHDMVQNYRAAFLGKLDTANGKERQLSVILHVLASDVSVDRLWETAAMIHGAYVHVPDMLGQNKTSAEIQCAQQSNFFRGLQHDSDREALAKALLLVKPNVLAFIQETFVPAWTPSTSLTARLSVLSAGPMDLILGAIGQKRRCGDTDDGAPIDAPPFKQQKKV